MKKRTLTTGTNTAAAVLILLAILALVNFLGYRHFVRADLTEAKEFTLSEATKTLCRDLDDLVNIKVYFSTDLPPRLMTMVGQVRDMLEEYRAFSGGKIKIEYIDPGSDPEMEQKLARIGIPKVQLNVIQRDKREVAAVYLGISISYGDRQEAIPAVRSLYNLEYDLTGALLRTSRKEDPVLGFLTGHGEKELESLTMLKPILEEQYQIRPVDLSSAPVVPEDVATLILAGASEVPETHKYAIDQFVMRGGKALVLLDPVAIEQGSMQAMPRPHTLGDMLSHYGLKTSPSMVCDGRSNAQAMFNQGYIRYSLPYPYWPRVRASSFATDIPAVSMLESLVLPWTGKVDLAQDRLVDGVEGAILATTSEAGWSLNGPFNLNPRGIVPPSPEELGPQNLVAAVMGRLPSFYAGKSVPTEEGGASPVQPAGARETLERSEETRIVVVPCSSFVEDQFLQMFPFNTTFILNVVDWLTLGDELIEIRSRQVTERPLEEITQGTKALIKYLNIFGVSILVVGFGLVRAMLRRRTKRLAEEGFRS